MIILVLQPRASAPCSNSARRALLSLDGQVRDASWLVHSITWLAIVIFGFSLAASATSAQTGASGAGTSLSGGKQGSPLIESEKGGAFREFNAAVKRAVRNASQSVVRIETIGGNDQVGDQMANTGATTGVVVSSEGHIISSGFNFAQEPSAIVITLPSKERLAAKIISRDRIRNLVLLKVEVTAPLTVPEPIDRSTLQVGQTTIAVGRTYSPETPNLSVGIVSATNRIWGRAVQTDAKISPSNYGGALIDLSGRVIGILTPLSLDEDSEVAGLDWYDSGIGFAIPLTDVLANLERMMQGEDLVPGLLGLAFKGSNIFVSPPLIAAVAPGSYADQAGIRSGDLIVNCDDKPIATMSELKHCLGRKFSGDFVELRYTRDSQTFDTRIQLVAEIRPTPIAFLGVLLARDQPASKEGVAIRFVFPESPAAKIGLQRGDRIVSFAGAEVRTPTELATQLAAQQVGEEVNVVWIRDESSSIEPNKQGLARQERLCILSEHSKLLPETLGTAMIPDGATEAISPDSVSPSGARNDMHAQPYKLLGDEHKCLAFTPSTIGNQADPGLLVVIPNPCRMPSELKDLVWQTIADHSHSQVVVLYPMDEARWMPDEVDSARRIIAQTLSEQSIDMRRIAVMGQGAGASLAISLAFSERQMVRGLALSDPISIRSARIRPVDPTVPLSVWMGFSSNQSEGQGAIFADALNRAQHLLFWHPGAEALTEERATMLPYRAELIRWLDTLDRM
jgi:serine protease Do